MGITLALAGCGSGTNANVGSTSAASSLVLERARLITAADTICKRLNSEFTASKPANQSVREIVRLAPIRVALERRAASELSRLKAPASIAPQLQEVIADRKVLAGELAQLADAAKRNDTAAIHSLAGSKARMHKQLATAAAAAGFESCAQLG